MNSGDKQKEFEADWAVPENLPPDPADENDQRNWRNPEAEEGHAKFTIRMILIAIGVFALIGCAVLNGDTFFVVFLTSVFLVMAGISFAYSKWFGMKIERKKRLFFMRQGNKKYWGRGEK